MTNWLLTVLEVGLARGERAGHVPCDPRVHYRPGGGVVEARRAARLAAADGLAPRPGRKLLGLGGERRRVLTDDVHERPGGVGVGVDAEAFELCPHPGGKVSRPRNLVRQHLTHLRAERRERRALEVAAGDEHEHRPGHGILDVGRDGLLIVLLPALDALDEHEAPAVPGEEAERVAGRDRLLPARSLGGEGLDRLRPEARAKALERTADLRTISAREEIDGTQLALGHRGQA